MTDSDSGEEMLLDTDIDDIQALRDAALKSVQKIGAEKNSSQKLSFAIRPPGEYGANMARSARQNHDLDGKPDQDAERRDTHKPTIRDTSSSHKHRSARSPPVHESAAYRKNRPAEPPRLDSGRKKDRSPDRRRSRDNGDRKRPTQPKQGREKSDDRRKMEQGRPKRAPGRSRSRSPRVPGSGSRGHPRDNDSRLKSSSNPNRQQPQPLFPRRPPAVKDIRSDNVTAERTKRHDKFARYKDQEGDSSSSSSENEEDTSGSSSSSDSSDTDQHDEKPRNIVSDQLDKEEAAVESSRKDAVPQKPPSFSQNPDPPIRPRPREERPEARRDSKTGGQKSESRRLPSDFPHSISDRPLDPVRRDDHHREKYTERPHDGVSSAKDRGHPKRQTSRDKDDVHRINRACHDQLGNDEVYERDRPRHNKRSSKERSENNRTVDRNRDRRGRRNSSSGPEADPDLGRSRDRGSHEKNLPEREEKYKTTNVNRNHDSHQSDRPPRRDSGRDMDRHTPDNDRLSLVGSNGPSHSKVDGRTLDEPYDFKSRNAKPRLPSARNRSGSPEEQRPPGDHPSSAKARDRRRDSDRDPDRDRAFPSRDNVPHRNHIPGESAYSFNDQRPTKQERSVSPERKTSSRDVGSPRSNHHRPEGDHRRSRSRGHRRQARSRSHEKRPPSRNDVYSETYPGQPAIHRDHVSTDHTMSSSIPVLPRLGDRRVAPPPVSTTRVSDGSSGIPSLFQADFTHIGPPVHEPRLTDFKPRPGNVDSESLDPRMGKALGLMDRTLLLHPGTQYSIANNFVNFRDDNFSFSSCYDRGLEPIGSGLKDDHPGHRIRLDEVGTTSAGRPVPLFPQGLDIRRNPAAGPFLKLVSGSPDDPERGRDRNRDRHSRRSPIDKSSQSRRSLSPTLNQAARRRKRSVSPPPADLKNTADRRNKAEKKLKKRRSSHDDDNSGEPEIQRHPGKHKSKTVKKENLPGKSETFSSQEDDIGQVWKEKRRREIEKARIEKELRLIDEKLEMVEAAKASAASEKLKEKAVESMESSGSESSRSDDDDESKSDSRSSGGNNSDEDVPKRRKTSTAGARRRSNRSSVSKSSPRRKGREPGKRKAAKAGRVSRNSSKHSPPPKIKDEHIGRSSSGSPSRSSRKHPTNSLPHEQSIRDETGYSVQKNRSGRDREKSDKGPNPNYNRKEPTASDEQPPKPKKNFGRPLPDQELAFELHKRQESRGSPPRKPLASRSGRPPYNGPFERDLDAFETGFPQTEISPSSHLKKQPEGRHSPDQVPSRSPLNKSRKKRRRSGSHSRSKIHRSRSKEQLPSEEKGMAESSGKSHDRHAEKSRKPDNRSEEPKFRETAKTENPVNDSVRVMASKHPRIEPPISDVTDAASRRIPRTRNSGSRSPVTKNYPDRKFGITNSKSSFKDRKRMFAEEKPQPDVMQPLVKEIRLDRETHKSVIEPIKRIDEDSSINSRRLDSKSSRFSSSGGPNPEPDEVPVNTSGVRMGSARDPGQLPVHRSAPSSVKKEPGDQETQKTLAVVRDAIIAVEKPVGDARRVISARSPSPVGQKIATWISDPRTRPLVSYEFSSPEVTAAHPQQTPGFPATQVSPLAAPPPARIPTIVGNAGGGSNDPRGRPRGSVFKTSLRMKNRVQKALSEQRDKTVPLSRTQMQVSILNRPDGSRGIDRQMPSRHVHELRNYSPLKIKVAQSGQLSQKVKLRR